MPRLSKIGAAALAAFGWTTGAASVTANFLVVAGGGSGGIGNASGGGGAGGYRTSAGTSGGGASAESAILLNPANTYTITVGAGGAATSSSKSNGGTSSISGTGLTTITSTGGGSGGDNTNQAGTAGGSGGGGGNCNASSTAAGGAGTANQGYAGGSVPINGSGAGGGGAGGVGANGYSVAVPSNPTGGVGVASTISGSSTYYAGGGGGGATGVTNTGGNGGGGNGGTGSVAPTSGTASTGGGGGGLAASGSQAGNGGSGIVIISYPAPQKFSGGVVTLSGGNVIHTFTTSGTLGPITTLSASYLIVAGGGSGGTNGGGGGGAGGLLSGSSLTIDPNSTYLVTVGAGGAATGTGTSTGISGSNSSFSMVSTAAVGGGYGGAYNAQAPAVGGSGGGAGQNGSTSTGAVGTAGQGSAGGGVSSGSAGGGGGAGGAGGTASSSTAGVGGVGTASSISGTSTYYAGGGGGGAGGGGSGGAGGNGGGGAGAIGSTNGTSGTINTGGGGGGQWTSGYLSGAGGSGVVIISYPGSTQQMAGGTVTIVGGNVIHTFTSTGYLAPIKYASNSLRFRASASAYLNRTPSVAGNRKTWTFSAWVKLGSLSTPLNLIYAYSADSDSGLCQLSYQSNQLRIQGYSASFLMVSNAVYRDPAAWYHVVYSVDTTQATAANRVRVYVNGVEITSWSTNTPPPQNTDTAINNSVAHNIGRNTRNSNDYYDGYMTEINLIDGQALAPTSFGTFNSYGVWQPITYGGSYGTNGFYLPFSPGTSSYSATLSGSNYVTAASNAAFAVGTNNFTMETWVYPTSQAGQHFFVASGGIQMGYQNSTTWGLCQANVAWLLTTSTMPTLNQWNHLAIVRSGTGSNQTAIFLNGTRVTQGTISTSFSQNTMVVGSGIIGNQSNSRLVNGTAIYDPTQTTITVPTSPLTNVSNTSILTFQNSSAIDNSSNAFTLTTTGTITYPVSNPFVILSSIAKDQGPAGNNWTINNISLQPAATTYDSMTDVPTLTSATAANYAVLNPLWKGSGAVITDGNLNNTPTTAVSAALITMPMSTGKWYSEISHTVTNASAVGMFFTSDNLSAPSFTIGSTTQTGLWEWYDNGAGVYVTSDGGAFGSSIRSSVFRTAGTFQFALDCDSGKFWFGKDNVWYNSTGGTTGDPATGANPTFTISTTRGPFNFGVGQNGGYVTMSLNCGQRPFTYTPPTGFIALNTYNL